MISMVFNFNFSALSICLFGVALLSLIYLCTFYFHRLFCIWKRKKQCEQSQSPDPYSLPRLSIIIYARNESEALQRNLPLMLGQDYPAGFEVIVVNEGSSPDTGAVVQALRNTYPNLYLTFTPDGARNLSRKKLALTLGIKAAKGDVVLITDAITHVDSDLWLQGMMKHFANPETSVVLGYGTPAFPTVKFPARLISIFDVIADSVPWLSAAICGHPYRGCGYNLAYRRQLFFDNKGFSRSLNLRAGDDDIFVNEITNESNTVVQLSDSSRVEQEAMPYKRAIKDDRISHAFTGRRLPKGSRLAMAIGEWCVWLTLACVVAGALVSGPANLAGWSVAAVLLVPTIVLYVIWWGKTLRTLGAPSLGFFLPFVALMRPWRRAILSLRSSMSKGGHYTWQ